MSGPAITDHALLRFLERGAGCDVETLREQLEQSLARAHEAARKMNSSDYLIKMDGLTFVVRGENVTTVLETGAPGREAHQLRGSH